MSQETMVNDLTTGSVPRKLMRFAVPFILSNLLQTMYGLVDMIIIGQFVGSAGLSAVSIGAEFLMMFTFVGMGFSTAGQMVIAQSVGTGDRKSLQKTIGTMFSFILACSIVMSVICLIGARFFLDLVNTPPEALSQAYDYTIVCYLGLFFVYGYNVVSAILRGMGDSKRPLLFVGIAAVANLLLDLLFVAVLDMASMGAALATVMGQGLSFVISLIYLYRRRESFGFDFKLKSFAIDMSRLRLILRLGLPMTLQLCSIVISMLFVNSYINAYGVIVSAVSGVGMKLGNIASVVSSAMGQAGASMIGQNVGAGKTDRVSEIVRVILVVNLGFALVLSVAMLLFPEQIFSLWSTEPEVLEMSHMYVPVAIITFFGFALRNPFIALVNGIGHAMLGLVIGVMDGIVARIGLALLLGIVLGLGVQGFWYGGALAGFVPVFIAGGYFLSGRWKTRDLLINK